MKRSLVFGPVFSRRLGRSLGIDLLPYKTCSLDCVYCQLGPTLCKTVQRGSFVNADELRAELRDAAARGIEADYVTLSGSGEPTLSMQLGEAIEEAKRLAIAPVAVLTNSTLLADARVAAELAGADLIVPSLDASDEEEFRRVNRPHPALKFEGLVEGLREFCAGSKNRIWLEVMLVEGMNDSDESLERFGELIKGLKVERVQLNTVVRPPAVAGIKAAAAERMRAAARIIGSVSGKQVEIVTEGEMRESRTAEEDAKRALVEMLLRRPCTLEELAKTLGRSAEETKAVVEKLARERNVVRERVGERDFFLIRPGSE